MVSQAFKHLFFVTVHYTYTHTQAAIVDCNYVRIPRCPQKNNLYIVSIVDCTHIGSATASFKDLVIFHRQNYQPNCRAMASFN